MTIHGPDAALGADEPILADRLHFAGEDAVADADLVAALLGGRRGHAAATELLRELGGLDGLERGGLAELSRFKGVGRARAERLRAALELGRRVAQLGPARRLALMASTDDVARYFRPRLAALDHERLYVVLVDCRNRAMRVELVARGGLVGLSVHPREILAPAIREAAAGVILVHNHPSGDPTPSMADRELTHRVRQAGEIVGIPLLDHVVVARGGALSV